MEISIFVDQRRRAVEQFFTAYATELSRQGSVVATYRTRPEWRLGPYYRLTCRAANGRQRSLYLGPDGPFVAAVRQRLQALQQARRERLQWARIRRAVRQGRRASQRAFAAELAAHGLTLRGTEIRGWRLRNVTAEHAPPNHATTTGRRRPALMLTDS